MLCYIFSYAIARARRTSVIHITGAHQQYEWKEWLAKDITIFSAQSNNITIIADHVLIAPAKHQSEISVKIEGVTIHGTIYVGDAQLAFKKTNLEGVIIQQEVQRQFALEIMSIRIEYSNLVNSVIATKLGDVDESVSLLYENCYSADVYMYDVAMTSSVIQLSANKVVIRLEQSAITNDLKNLDYTGFIITTGIPIKVEQNLTLSDSIKTVSGDLLGITKKLLDRFIKIDPVTFDGHDDLDEIILKLTDRMGINISNFNTPQEVYEYFSESTEIPVALTASMISIEDLIFEVLQLLSEGGMEYLHMILPVSVRQSDTSVTVGNMTNLLKYLETFNNLFSIIEIFSDETILALINMTVDPTHFGLQNITQYITVSDSNEIKTEMEILLPLFGLNSLPFPAYEAVTPSSILIRKKRAQSEVKDKSKKVEESAQDWLHLETTRIAIDHCVFQNLGRHDQLTEMVHSSFYLEAYDKFDMRVFDSIFTGNYRGIDIDFKGSDKGTVFVARTNFTDNFASGPGGAIRIDQSDGQFTLTVENCVFKDNFVYSKGYNSDNTESDNSDGSTNKTYIKGIQVSKTTGSGGGIGVILKSDVVGCESNLLIRNCQFLNNTAQSYGGSIYITPGVKAHIADNEFENVQCGNNTQCIRPRVGDIIEARGAVVMNRNKFIVKSAVNEIPIISYRADMDGSFLESADLDFVCPPGFKAKPVYSAIQASHSRFAIETLLIYCRSCNEGELILLISIRHTVHFFKTNSESVLFIHQFKNSCRYYIY